MQKMTITDKLERHRIKTINYLTYSAASMLRDDDINNTHNVKASWDAFNNVYLPELKPIVEKLIEQNVSHIYIPRMAKKIWMDS